MNDSDELARTAARLRDALHAAADLMPRGATAEQARDSATAVPAPRRPRSGHRRSGHPWLAPLAAAAAVAAVLLASVLVTSNLGRSATTGGSGTSPGGTSAAPPEFYLVLDYVGGTGTVEVRRTADGTVTGSEALPGHNDHWSDYLTAEASDRAFYIASAPVCSWPSLKATSQAQFYRITIDGSGRISGIHPVGSPVGDLVLSPAVSPDGSQLAYTTLSSCRGSGSSQLRTEIHVMNLSTGAVRTWQNTATAPGPSQVTEFDGQLSWTPDGRTVIAQYSWGSLTRGQLGSSGVAVLGLDVAGPGGSLQASSRVLFSQDDSCASCIRQVVAGPADSLTAVELGSGRQLVVRIPLTPGQAQTVLYSAPAPSARPLGTDAAVFADPSGQWVITWPPYDGGTLPNGLLAGWIQDGTLISLPGTALTSSVPGTEGAYAIAW
jgi:hypothetical protein